jgi:hypothetical protein
MSQPETILSNEIRLALGKHARHARLFRNYVGQCIAGKILDWKGDVCVISGARKVEAGLCTGSGDLIGYTTIRVTQEMVGMDLAIFTSAEVKTSAKVKTTMEQFNWRNNVLEAGGRAGIVITPEDALKLVKVAP